MSDSFEPISLRYNSRDFPSTRRIPKQPHPFKQQKQHITYYNTYGYYLQIKELFVKSREPVWHAGLRLTRTRSGAIRTLNCPLPDIPTIGSKKAFRNPLICAIELNDELVRDNLTRKQLAERHGISSDRITQWLCLLKLPMKIQRETIALGDYWEIQLVTERELRSLRREGTNL